MPSQVAKEGVRIWSIRAPFFMGWNDSGFKMNENNLTFLLTDSAGGVFWISEIREAINRMGKHFTSTMVQVTKAIPAKLKLSGWERYLENKGFKTEIRETRRDHQPTYYALWRNLTEIEIVQLNAGKLKIKNNFLEFAADNSSKRRGSYR